MADVYLATTLDLQDSRNLLAIKLLRETDDPEFVNMFLNEGRIATRLNHPNIVQTYEAGQDNDDYFLAMEFLPGPTLHSLREVTSKKNNPLDIRLWLFILSNVLNGLQYAHELKDNEKKSLEIVHRDLTPHNVITTFDGECKILDFGIAKANNSALETSAGIFKGKIAYASPEQAQGNKVDCRSDLFSVSILLWEIITGQSPWKGLSGDSVFRQLSKGEIPSLKKAQPNAPSELVLICEKGLSFEPEKRFSSAREFRYELNQFLLRHTKPVSSQELSAVVTTLFENERARMLSIVENQLLLASQDPAAKLEDIRNKLPLLGNNSKHRTRPSFPVYHTHKIKNRLYSRVDGNIEKTSDLPKVTSQSNSSISDFEIEVEETSPKLFLYFLFGSAAILALALVIVLWHVRPPIPKPIPNLTVSTPQPKPAKKSNIELRIFTNPSNAHLSLDSAPLSSNPFSGTYPEDQVEHELTITAPGYEPVIKKIQFDKSQVVNVTLEKLETPSEPKQLEETKTPKNLTGHGFKGPQIKTEHFPILSKPETKPKRSIDSEIIWNH
jgi:serine/threonine-protein kinase